MSDRPGLLAACPQCGRWSHMTEDEQGPYLTLRHVRVSKEMATALFLRGAKRTEPLTCPQCHEAGQHREATRA